MAKKYYGQNDENIYRFDANAAYDLSHFDASRSNTAPQKEVQPRKVPKLELVDQPVTKTYNQLRREERQGLIKAMKVMVVSMLLFGLLGTVIYGETQKNQITREISKAQTQLNAAKSDNTRLSMALNSIVSLDNIEQYATEKLGMVKIPNQQISYINLEEENIAKKAEKEKLAAEKDAKDEIQKNDNDLPPATSENNSDVVANAEESNN